jgi:hypothetical protein
VIISYELNALSMKMSELLYRMPFQSANEVVKVLPPKQNQIGLEH